MQHLKSRNSKTTDSKNLKTQRDITKPKTETKINHTHLRHYLHKAETPHFIQNPLNTMFLPHKEPDTVWINDSQWIHTPLYIPTYNELRITPSTHIHPDSLAAQLDFTPEDLEPILQHQQEHLPDEYAQPPLISAKPIIDPDSAAAQLGLTSEDMEEVIADQIEWMREEEEQEWRAEGHTVAEEAHYQHDQQEDDTGTQPLFPLLRNTQDVRNNMVNDDNDEWVSSTPG
jgi:hypothetical protein